MEEFKPKKGLALLEIIMYIVVANGLYLAVNSFVNSYIELTLLQLLVILFNIYCIYYLLITLTLKYQIENNIVIINSLMGIRKIKIHLDDIDGYNVSTGPIKGFKLSGFGRDRYGFGNYVVDNVGVTHMFASSNSEVIYLHSSEISYGISPIDAEKFKNIIEEKDIELQEFETKVNKNRRLYKDKKLFVPFILTTVIIFYIILNPFILYLKQALPASMPLSFDGKFKPIVMGTGKNFVFKQMSYGVLNMIILFCMYYASHFNAKYDKRSAYKFIYIALAIALAFLLFQIKILNVYL